MLQDSPQSTIYRVPPHTVTPVALGRRICSGQPGPYGRYNSSLRSDLGDGGAGLFERELVRLADALP
jgi:hypothetical protein